MCECHTIERKLGFLFFFPPPSARSPSLLEGADWLSIQVNLPMHFYVRVSKCVPQIKTQTSWHQMHQESLCQQHLATAQHAAPATVCGPGGALQLRELPPVREPDPGHKSETKPLHLI